MPTINVSFNKNTIFLMYDSKVMELGSYLIRIQY